VSAECLDDGAAAVGTAGEMRVVKGHGGLAVRDAPRAAPSAPLGLALSYSIMFALCSDSRKREMHDARR
jgi:hypothetical protein